jgi:hypothetical protein
MIDSGVERDLIFLVIKFIRGRGALEMEDICREHNLPSIGNHTWPMDLSERGGARRTFGILCSSGKGASTTRIGDADGTGG